MLQAPLDDTLMLMPNAQWTTDSSTLKNIRGYHLFENISWPANGHFVLHLKWGDKDLPSGYDYYVLSWHMEYIDFDWLHRQKVDAPILLLCDYNIYETSMFPTNVTVIRWYYWHVAMQQLHNWFGSSYTKDIKYKVSAFCNRITQSKMIVTSALLEHISKEQMLLSVSDWLEEKNVHQWKHTGNAELDYYTDCFRNKYLGHKIVMDEFDNSLNYQRYTGNPAQIAYQEAAIHFTNESFHYSLMHDGDKKHILPGPNFSEKTMKCWLGGTAFIPVGQFDVYQTLSKLGMKFDYGLDLSFDQDPGNLTRLEKTVKLVKDLNEYSALDLYKMTKHSSEHNQQLIVSGDFYQTLEKSNHSNLEQITEYLKHV
jgi:hypothetical protein